MSATKSTDTPIDIFTRLVVAERDRDQLAADREELLTRLKRAERDRDAYLRNLTDTQTRCTELLLEVRGLRGQPPTSPEDQAPTFEDGLRVGWRDGTRAERIAVTGFLRVGKPSCGGGSYEAYARAIEDGEHEIRLDQCSPSPHPGACGRGTQGCNHKHGDNDASLAPSPRVEAEALRQMARTLLDMCNARSEENARLREVARAGFDLAGLVQSKTSTVFDAVLDHFFRLHGEYEAARATPNP